MYVYNRHYVLCRRGTNDKFLTEDKDYTSQIEYAQRFASEGRAVNKIVEYAEQERDEDYSGDFYVANEIEVKMVETTIQ